jgi:hypothetical protein
MCFSSPNDDEVGGLRSAIRSERSEQSNTATPTAPADQKKRGRVDGLGYLARWCSSSISMG